MRERIASLRNTLDKEFQALLVAAPSLTFEELADAIRRELRSGPRLAERNEALRQLIELLRQKIPAMVMPPLELSLQEPHRASPGASVSSPPRLSKKRKQLRKLMRLERAKPARDRHAGIERLVATIVVEKRNASRAREAKTSWEQEHSHQLRIVRGLTADLAERLTASTMWDFFPPSGSGRAQVIAAFRRAQQRDPGVRYDMSRISFAFSLKPTCYLKGRGEFNDYCAFPFSNEAVVLLENPVEGNAAYIFGRDWRLLSRLSRSELLDRHHERLVRVIHVGDWRQQIRSALRHMRK